MRRRFAVQAAANVTSVVTNAAFGVGSTLVVSRALDRTAFSVWVLVISIAAYVTIVEGGIAGAVVRQVAASPEAGSRVRIVRGAVCMLLGVAAPALLGLVLAARPTSWLLAGVPDSVRSDACVALLLVGGANVLSLPAAAFRGLFAGIGKPWTPATINALTKAGAAAALIALHEGIDLFQAASIIGSGTLASAVVLTLAAMRELGPGVAAIGRVRREDLSALRAETATLLFWSVALLAIGGLDSLVVSHFDFERVGAFGVAAQLVALVIAVYASGLTPLLPAAAHISSGTPEADRQDLLLRGTRLGMGALAAACGALFVVGPVAMELVYGQQLAGEATPLLRALLAAVVVRQVPAVLALVRVGTGDHRTVRAAPAAEAAANLAASITFAWMFGAVGVALGTLVGGMVAIGAHSRWTLGASGVHGVTRRTWLMSAVRASWPPILAAALGSLLSDRYRVLLPVALAAIAFAWCSTLDAAERTSLGSALRRATTMPAGRARRAAPAAVRHK